MGGGSYVSAHVSPLYGRIPNSELPTVFISVLVRLGDNRSMTEHQLKTEMPPFAMVPRWIKRNEELTAGAVRIYACLADMAGRDRPAWPSHRTLAQNCNMSVSSV